MVLLSVATLLTLSACAPSRDGFFVDILVPTDEGLIVAEGEILDVIDAPSGVGAGYRVTGAPTFSLHYLYDRALDGEAFNFDELTVRSRQNIGAPLNMALTFDPFVDRYALADENSLISATLMHHVSHILRDYRNVYGEHSTAITTEFLVGLQGELRLWDQAPVDVTALGGDTAYHPFGDGVFIGESGPFSLAPKPVSPGLVAHELQHRVFWHNIIVGGAFDAWTQIFRELDVDPRNPLTILPARHVAGLDMLRYRAFDEGLANLFGAAYSGNSNIYRDVYQYPAPDQDLDIYVSTFGHTTDVAKDCLLLEPIGEDSVQNVLMSQEVYSIGSPMLARFWKAADGDQARVREVVIPAVVDAFADIAADSLRASEQAGHFRFSIAQTMNHIAERLPEPERNNYCFRLGCVNGCTLRASTEHGRVPGVGGGISF